MKRCFDGVRFEGPLRASPRGDPAGPGAGGSSRRIRIGLVCRLPREAVFLESRLRARRDLVVEERLTDEVEVVICAAAAARTLTAMLATLPGRTRQRAVLLDLEDDIGPAAAGHNGCLGYCPADCPLDRLVSCCRYVANNRADAPEPYAGEFHAARERGVLTMEQCRLLAEVVRDYTQAELVKQLGLSRPTLLRKEEELRLMLDLGYHHPLDGAAVELGQARVLAHPGAVE